MFKHIYITRLKCLLRDKEMIFWSLLFPIVLALLFNVAFSGLNEHESFDPVSIAVVRDSAYEADSAFREALRSASAGADKLFDLE